MNMEKNYQAIDGVNLEFKASDIRDVLGVAGSVIESQAIYLGTVTRKFAFYNTGELCEAQYIEGKPLLRVCCHGNRRMEILGWLKQYLTNSMHTYGWGTETIENKDGYFYAKFYKEEN